MRHETPVRTQPRAKSEIMPDTNLARQSARAFITSGDESFEGARLQTVLNIFESKVLARHGIKEVPTLRVECSTSPCLTPDSRVKVTAHRRLIGYLAVEEIKAEDKDKFFILAQQFIIGIRRALLYQKVQELTITDSLTQVYNRRYFLERFHEELERSQKNNLNLSFLMLDVDNFKKYNDRYGHLVGDAILRQVAKTIRDTVRQIDFIGRYGGEEISIVLTETGRQQAGFVAERIRRAIEDSRFLVYDENLSVQISIGVSIFPENSLKALQLIEKADQALYQAKETGKNKVCFYKGN